MINDLCWLSIWSSSGPSGFEKVLESVPHTVWKHHHTFWCSEVCVVHGVLHYRGAGLLQHRRQHRTLEWQKLPWPWQQHLKTRESLCLMPLNIAVCRFNKKYSDRLNWTILPIIHCLFSLKDGEKAFLLEFTLNNILLPSFNVKWTNTSITGPVFVLCSICLLDGCAQLKCKYSALFSDFICNALLCLIFVPVIKKDELYI